MSPFETASTNEQLTIWTIGHSTRSLDEFEKLLDANDIKCLVDVRSFPGSRRYPHFNREELSSSLEATGIKYRHVPELGGRRRPNPNSANTAWQNASFRAYADHMESAEFKKGTEELLELVRQQNVVIMCAEAVWWSCHRSLIADYLKSMGLEVLHILSEGKVQSHPYTAAARIIEGKLSYRGLLPA